jgi:Tfp pilus assembly protein PilW
MDCRITSTDRQCAGLTLAETLVAVGIGSIVLTAVVQLIVFSGRSFSSMLNYVDLDDRSNRTLERMSRDIRQANNVASATAISLVLNDADNTPLEYIWNSTAKTLTRTKGGVSTTMLRDCEFLQFSIYQRNPMPGAYDYYETAIASNAKMVQVSWVCARKVLGTLRNSESVQSAKFVIRKQ